MAPKNHSLRNLTYRFLGPNFFATEEIASVSWSNIMFRHDFDERDDMGTPLEDTYPMRWVKEELPRDGPTENPWPASMDRRKPRTIVDSRLISDVPKVEVKEKVAY